MQRDGWVRLLQVIPAARHNVLTLLTATGIEITITAILRMEEEFLVLRGRLAGTSDAGRIFFVPYEHIDHLGTLIEIKEEEIEAIFGGPPTFTAAAPAVAASAGHAESPPPPPEPMRIERTVPEPVPEEAAAPPGPPRNPTPARGVRSVELLERIRQRASVANGAHKPHS